jgi:hypothetical protein
MLTEQTRTLELQHAVADNVQSLHHHSHAALGGSNRFDHASRGGGLQFSWDPGLLLFSWWHPSTPATYAISLAIIFTLAAASDVLSARAALAAPPLLRSHGSAVDADEDASSDTPFYDSVRASSAPWITGSVRVFGLHALSISLNFALMLLVMTFNIGVCAAVVGGLAVGRTLLAHSRRLRPTPRPSAAELCP